MMLLDLIRKVQAFCESCNKPSSKQSKWLIAGGNGGGEEEGTTSYELLATGGPQASVHGAKPDNLLGKEVAPDAPCFADLPASHDTRLRLRLRGPSAGG